MYNTAFKAILLRWVGANGAARPFQEIKKCAPARDNSIFDVLTNPKGGFPVSTGRFLGERFGIGLVWDSSDSSFKF